MYVAGVYANAACIAGIYAYVTLKEGNNIEAEKFKEEIKNLVKKQIASYAIPDIIQVSYNLV